MEGYINKDDLKNYKHMEVWFNDLKTYINNVVGVTWQCVSRKVLHKFIV